MSSESLQIQLFHSIRSILPVNFSVVDVVAEKLEISTDSAYRRIRGEKTLSLDEVAKLCKHFQISLDNLMNLNSGGFIFNGSFVQPATFKFDEYLNNIIQQVKYMNGFKERQMYQLCKDRSEIHQLLLTTIWQER